MQESVKLEVHVIPGAAKNEIDGLFNGRLKVRLKAKPKDGEANRELKRFIAKILHIAKSDVEIIRGECSRDKVLQIKGVAEIELGKLLYS